MFIADGDFELRASGNGMSIARMLHWLWYCRCGVLMSFSGVLTAALTEKKYRKISFSLAAFPLLADIHKLAKSASRYGIVWL